MENSNKEKQIEEMAKAIYRLDYCEGYKDDRGCMYAPSCSVCKSGRENKAKQISVLIANQGYRKASEVAEEVIDEIFKILDAEYRQYDTVMLSDTLNKMYMSSRNTVIKITAELVELKKKFTEDSKNG